MVMHEHLLAGAHLTKDEAVPDIQSGDLRIYIRRRQVFRGQTEIPLTGKEFNLLLYLAQHPNQVLSKKELFEKIWHLDAGRNGYGHGPCQPPPGQDEYSGTGIYSH